MQGEWEIRVVRGKLDPTRWGWVITKNGQRHRAADGAFKTYEDADKACAGALISAQLNDGRTPSDDPTA